MQTIVDVQGGVRDYINEVVEIAVGQDDDVVSIIIFGSVAKGGFTPGTSDVDVIVVLADGALRGRRKEIKRQLAALELKHGLRELPRSKTELVYRMIDRMGGLFLSHFVCYKHDLLAGNSARAFDVNPLADLLLLSTRIGFASIVMSAKTVWGEDLLKEVRILPITRWHLLKNCLAYLSLNALALLTFPVLPNATKYAMAALKGSLHSCYFCYNLKSTTIELEMNFFSNKFEGRSTLAGLLSLRQDYRSNFRFVRKCFPTIMRLFIMTAREIRFPLYVNFSVG